jgi:hypothetical protein
LEYFFELFIHAVPLHISSFLEHVAFLKGTFPEFFESIGRSRSVNSRDPRLQNRTGVD